MTEICFVIKYRISSNRRPELYYFNDLKCGSCNRVCNTLKNSITNTVLNWLCVHISYFRTILIENYFL